MTLSSAGIEPLDILKNYKVKSTEIGTGIKDKEAIRTWFSQIDAGARIQLDFKVALDATPNRDKAIEFPPTHYIFDNWLDSITNFNDGTSGEWTIGTAGRDAIFRLGTMDVITIYPDNSGTVLYRDFTFTKNQQYRFTLDVLNYSPHSDNVAPILEVFAPNMTIIPRYTVPRDAKWKTLANTFSFNESGEYTIRIHNHQERGSGSGTEGGNDFQLDNIIVTRE